MPKDTPGLNRRRFMKVSGAVLGGMAAGSTVVAAERSDRFIVDTSEVSGGDLEQAVDVVHDMSEVDLAVVEGSESALESVTGNFEADVEIELDDPELNSAAPTVDESGALDEPGYGLQWDKHALAIPEAHDTTKGAGTRVTVIDSGVAAGHPDIAVNEALSVNFTNDGYGSGKPIGGGHGTHVGGIIGASDNGEGVIGTAPDTELVDCRVFSTSDFSDFGWILAAIVYSANIGADAANLSLGAYPLPRQGLGQFYGQALNRVMTYANNKGTLLVVAAGNDSADLQHDQNLISLPNEGAQGLSVSATGPNGYLWDADGDGEVTDFVSPPESPAFYTNYGTNAIDIAAPGGDAVLDAIDTGVPWYNDLVFNTYSIPSFNEDGDYHEATHTYSWVAGTSMAAPQVAGAAALVKSANPGYNANQVEAALKDAAEVPEGYDKTYYGSGFLNVVEAL